MNIKEIIKHLDEDIKEVDELFKNYESTYEDVMNWEIQGEDNAIFDAGYKSALLSISRFIKTLK